MNLLKEPAGKDGEKEPLFTTPEQAEPILYALEQEAIAQGKKHGVLEKMQQTALAHWRELEARGRSFQVSQMRGEMVAKGYLPTEGPKASTKSNNNELFDAGFQEGVRQERERMFREGLDLSEQERRVAKALEVSFEAYRKASKEINLRDAGV